MKKALQWIVIIGIGILAAACNRNPMASKIICKHMDIPLDKEVTQQNLPIQGKVPAWLNGTFVRNGPISVEIDGQKMAHWFDGLAMLHAFSFRKGNIVYSNKFIKSQTFDTVMHEGSLKFFGFDSLPDNPLSVRIKAFFNPPPCPPIQNANVNVTEVAHQYVALTEIPLPVRFDINNANTLGALDFQDDLPKGLVFESAHPQFDGRTKEKFNYIVDYGFRSKYLIYRYHPEIPCRELISKIPVKKPSYMHSFAMTEHYIILVEFPLIVTPFDIMFMTKPFITNYYWKPEKGTNFLIIDRKTGCLVKKIRDCQPFFAFHHVNAYEEGDNIILDIVTYPDASIIWKISEHGYLSAPGQGEQEHLNNTRLMRYCLSLNDANACNGTAIQNKVLFEGPYELPRINEQYSAHRHRYVYVSDQRLVKHPGDLRPIVKIDTQSSKKVIWQEAGLMPGEPVFIPNPQARDEDDGVIVTIMLDEIHQKAFLLILDGKTFKELARAYAPFSIPVGLHGQFFVYR